MKIVMTFGTFDIFHKGHENYLKQARLHRYAKHCGQAKKLGDYLVVVVARDKNVEKIKNKEARNKEQKRKNFLENSNLADKVVLGNLKDKYAVIKKYKPNIIALGYDQKVDLTELRKKIKELKLKAKIVRLKAFHPEKYKSSKFERVAI